MKKVAAISLILVLVAGVALAQGHMFGGQSAAGHGRGPGSLSDGSGGPGRGPGGEPGLLAGLGRLLSGGPFMKILSRLGLTDDQHKRIDAIHEEAMLKSIDQGAALLKDFIHFKSAMKADAPDVQAVEKLIDDMAARGAELAKAVTGAMIKAKAELTPEQRKKAEELIKDLGHRGGRHGQGFMKRMGRGRGRGRDGRPGDIEKRGFGRPGQGCEHERRFDRGEGRGSGRGAHRGMERRHRGNRDPLGMLDFSFLEEEENESGDAESVKMPAADCRTSPASACGVSAEVSVKAD